MRKLLLFLVFLCLSAWGGNGRIMKTSVTGMSASIEGVDIKVKVQLSMEGIDKKDYVCFVLMTNGKWKEDASLEELAQLSDVLCYSDFLVSDEMKGNIGTVEVAVPLEHEGLCGKEQALYLRAYLVDTKNRRLLSKGDFVKYKPDSSTSAQDIEKSLQSAMMGGLVEGLFNSLFSGSSGSSNSDSEKCIVCKGHVTCQACSSYDPESRKNCSHCGGNGHCPNYR